MSYYCAAVSSPARQNRGTVARFFLWAAVVWIASMSVATAQTDRTWRTELGGFVDGLVTTGLDQDAVAGAVVIVTTSDEVLLSRGYRMSDARTGRPFSPEEDIVPLASVSKIFTALAILELVEDGRIALGDPIAQYLPGLDLQQSFGEITILHLLSHTAGLEERYSGYLAERGGASRMNRISAVLPRQIRPPEEAIAYSNASYVLLGEIVAQVTGQPYDTYLADTILASVGINGPHFMHDRSQTNRPVPFHVWDAGRYVALDPQPFPEIHSPSGGIALTASDMGRFMQVLLRRDEGTGADDPFGTAIMDMERPISPRRDEFSGRTLGYWTETWAGHTVYYHGGTHFGFHTNMVLIPALDLAFFVAANGPSGAAIMGLPRRVLREVVAPQEATYTAPAKCSRDCLATYAGSFITTRRNETGADRLRVRNTHVVEVRPEENGMLLVSGLGYSRLFQATGDNHFMTPEGDLSLGFRRGSDGVVVGAYLNGGIHSFDRLRFWQRAISLHSGLVAALTGSLVCLAGPALAWRDRRAVMVTPVWLGLVWIASVAGITASLAPMLFGRDMSSQASAAPSLWITTGLFCVALLSVMWVVIWLVRPAVSGAVIQRQRYLVLAALPFFIWAMVVAWMWNIPTAALTW